MGPGFIVDGFFLVKSASASFKYKQQGTATMEPQALEGMGHLTAVIAGLGLSAAAGFRVFVPLLALSIAGRMGAIPVADDFAWIVSLPALIVFGTATVAEVASYYLPWVDNLLDAVASPAAVVSGTVITASLLPEMPDVLQWGMAAVLGGGSAGVVQASTVLTRGASTATSGGIANPVVATVETGGSILTSMLVFVIPVVVGILVFILLCYCLRTILSWLCKRPARA